MSVPDEVNEILANSPDETDSAGPWITAGFDGPCAYGDEISEGDTIRADGDGTWVHQDCEEWL